MNPKISEKLLIAFISYYGDQEKLLNLIKSQDNSSIKEINHDLNSFVYQIVLFTYIRKSLTYRCTDINKQKRMQSAREIMVLNCVSPNMNNEYVNLIPAEAYGNEAAIIECISSDLNEIMSDDNVNRVVKKLTDKQRLIIQKIMLEEKSEKEIALELGITIQGVNKLKNSALDNIRKGLVVA